MHTTEVWVLAFVALVERAIVHRKASDIIEIDVTFSNYSSSLVIPFIDGLSCCQLLDLSLEPELFVDQVGEFWHEVALDGNLLLAGGAVQISERDTKSGPSVTH